jgi:hypothetical protein
MVVLLAEVPESGRYPGCTPIAVSVNGTDIKNELN